MKVVANKTRERTAGASGEFASDDERWGAIVRRSAQAAGRFVYGVRTTGVYCRPNCSSRRPNRTNVDFFAWPKLAEAAGYRACRRCRPNEARVTDASMERVVAACRFIESSRSSPGLDAIARAAGVSRPQLHRLYQRHLGVSPKAYAATIRAGRLKRELRRASSVSQAILAAGFGSAGRCYEHTDAILGMTPGEFRRKGRGMRIEYAIADCGMGRVLVAATDRGVCHIALGERDEQLRADLRSTFPAAEPAIPASAFERLVRRVVREVDSPAGECSFPLDIRGTAFQKRVWAALRAIPAGETFSYSEIAEAIDRPNATRAVASACAANALAIAIPCHRAVRADGGIGGYRWGLARKKEILRRERAVVADSKGDA